MEYIEYLSLIKRVEDGTAPWQKSWRAGETMPPYNPASRKPFSGINRLMMSMMSMNGNPSPSYYLSDYQANRLGWSLKPNAKGHIVELWQFEHHRQVFGKDGQPVLDERGQPRYYTEELEELERPALIDVQIFHFSQFLDRDGRPIEFSPPRPDVGKALEKAEALLVSSGAKITHHDRGVARGASYDLKKDEIILPRKEDFKTAGDYYQTALHELVRCVRHPDRLNRPAGPAGSPDYAKEELRAEIAAWMLAQDLGLPYSPKAGASYAKEWAKALKDDEYELSRAARDAEKIKGYLLGMDARRSQKAGEAEPAPLKTVIAQENTYLVVPYKEKEAARAAGAKWDRRAKRWFAPAASDLAKQARWVCDEVRRLDSVLSRPFNEAVKRLDEALSPPEEFALFLAKAGLKVEGAPRMDGQVHSCAVEGGRPGNKDGRYLAQIKDYIKGWAENPQIGQRLKWVATGHFLSEEQKQALKLEEAIRSNKELKRLNSAISRARNQGQEPEDYVELLWERNRKTVALQLASSLGAAVAPTLDASEGYLLDKGFRGVDIAKIDPDLKMGGSGDLLVAGRDIEGELVLLQHLSHCKKNIEQGAKEDELIDFDCWLSGGAFHALGDMGESPSGILLAESYVDGLTLHLATGLPVAVAFDANNLEPVAKVLRDKFPEAILTICCPDRNSEYMSTYDGAIQASQAVNARILLPNFTEEEKTVEGMALRSFNDLHRTHGLQAVRAMFGIVEEKAVGLKESVEKWKAPPAKTSAPAAEAGLSR